MIRTRDFFLFVVVVVFLLVGIGTAVADRFSKVQTVSTEPIFVTSEINEVASVAVQEPDRASRRAQYRDTIAAGATLYIQEEFYEADALDGDEDDVVGNTVQYCPNYRAYAGQLLGNTMPLIVREGARVIYQEEAIQASTSVATAERTVALAIPLRAIVAGSPACLSTDVIGVTLGGTLIRNTDVVRYAGFSATTLIGYALDGLPIYGQSDVPLDQCGGAVVNGQYQYHLSLDADTLLRCFTGVPAELL